MDTDIIGAGEADTGATDTVAAGGIAMIGDAGGTAEVGGTEIQLLAQLEAAGIIYFGAGWS